MKKIILLLAVTIILTACKQASKLDIKETSTSAEVHKKASIQDLISNLKDSKNKEIIVVAHRGDWRNAPENSLQAIQNCINMGVDMVEIDIRETKDGHLVLMHDKSIERTTTGEGMIADWTLDSLSTLFLKDGLGVATAHKIPTLKAALELSKDKILVNLDKSYDIFDHCYEIIKETKTQNQVIIKGAKSKSEINKEFGQYLDKIIFMPIVKLSNPHAKEIVDEYMAYDAPEVIEFTAITDDTLQCIIRFQELREKGTSVKSIVN